MSKQTKSGPRSIERSWLCAVALASVAVGSAACTTPQSGSARVAAAPNATSSAPTSGAKRAQVDERRPEYWLQRLEHPSQRVSALQRLNGFYEDTVKRVNHDQHNPERLALVELLVEPLTRCYVQSYSELDEKTRENLIRLLAALRDPRTAPALAKAFDVFAATQQGRRDVQHAALAVTELQLRSVAAPVFRAFRVFHLSDQEDPVYEALNGALLAVADPAWTQELIGMLATPLRTDEVEDLASRARFLDSVGRVNTAAQVLGELRRPEAARPLLQLLLDPRRLTIKAAVRQSLLQIGRPAVSAAVALLSGADNGLLAWQREQVKATASPDPGHYAYIDTAAAVIGGVGVAEGIAPVLTALAAARSDEERIPLLVALATLPHTDAVKAAFLEGFPKVSGERDPFAFSQLGHAARSFFNPSLTEVLLRRGRELKRDRSAVLSLAYAAVDTMDSKNVSLVTKFFADLIPKPDPNIKAQRPVVALFAAFQGATDTLSQCKDKAACYLEVAIAPENQDDRAASVSAGALYRAGQLAGPEIVSDVVAAMARFQDIAQLQTAALIISHHLPQGSIAIADQLQVLIDDNARNANDALYSATMLRELSYRLRARATR